MRRGLLVCILLFFSHFICSAQSWDYSYTHYGKIDGLPSNKIYFLCKGIDGVLWIGTDAGLCRYDGNHFKIFTTENGLPSNDVFELTCDHLGRIWIVTMSNQIAYIYKGKIHNATNDTVLAKVIIPDRISRIVEDRFGAIWITSFPFTISRILPTNEVSTYNLLNNYGNCFKVNLTSKGIHFITDSTSLAYDYSSRLFVPSKAKLRSLVNDIVVLNDSVSVFSDSNNELVLCKKSIGESNYFTHSHVLSVFKAGDRLWQLSNKGISSYPLSNFSESTMFLKNYSVSNFVIDRYSNIWVSTLYNGLFKLNSLSAKIVRIHSDESSNSIHSLLINNNSVLAGNNNGEICFVNKNKPNDSRSIHLNAKSVLSFRILKLILRGKIIIVCSDVGIYSYDIISHKLKPIYPNQSCKNAFLSGDSLIVLNNVGVTYFDRYFEKTKELMILDRFYSHTTYNNKKLFGSENTLYYEADSLIEYKLDQSFHYRMMDMKTVDSMLVVATTEKGVFFIHKNKIVRNLNLGNGLNSNNCAKVLPYKNELFIATNNGICRYNYFSNSMIRIMESDGLASNNVLDIAIDRDTLYAGTDNGLSIMPLSSLNPRSNFIFFINPVIHEKDTMWDLSHGLKSRTDHTVSLMMNAVSLGVKGSVRYYYRIKEKDTNYISTAEPLVSLTLLNPGKYTFEAYSIDVNGLKSIMAILPVEVVPYWWQTVVFKWCCVFAVLLALYLLYRIMNYVIKKREQERHDTNNRIKKLELDAWKSNINPHFMFNSFNTIQSLFSSNQHEKANEFIANFSGVLRKTIDNSGRLMNKFSEEISYLQNYLELERIKRRHKLTYQIYANEKELDGYYIPSLLIQPIIENAIKHGVKHQKKGHIVIEFKIQATTITAVVRDNGVGLPDKNKNYVNSQGLKLIRDKIRIVEHVTHTHIGFTIENVYDANGNCLGVAATFVIPKYTDGDYDFN